MKSIHRICKRCVMDESMPGTVFDNAGICNNCHEFDQNARRLWFPNEIGAAKLKKAIDEIQRKGYRNEYDCLLGLSGGVDSSFLALKVKEWGLRPLVFHVDAGWNSELAVKNIETVVHHCNFDLFTEVVGWEAMKDLQLAYFRSGVYNQDVPQDHVFFASLFHFAKSFKIKSIVSGHNFATESVPMRWQHSAMDRINLLAIHRAYGRKKKLENYKTISFMDYYFVLPLVYGIKFYSPLNLMRYERESAILQLQSIGWRKYDRKHGESLFTKFFQEYYLPIKHGIDKRKAHLSSLVLAGFISRQHAIEELARPAYEEASMQRDIRFFQKKLGLQSSEFEEIMKSPVHLHSDYANWNRIRSILSPFKSISRSIRLR